MFFRMILSDLNSLVVFLLIFDLPDMLEGGNELLRRISYDQEILVGLKIW